MKMICAQPQYVLIILLVLSSSNCFFNRLGNIVLRELNEFQNFVENSQTWKEKHNKTFSRKIIKASSKIESSGMDLFELLYQMLKAEHQRDNYKVFQMFNNRAYKNKEESLIKRLMKMDIMFLYAIGEVLISLFLAFIIIPIIVILRNWSKVLCRKKLNERQVKNLKEIREIAHNFDFEEICSICLDKVLVDDSNNSNNEIGHLNCGHNYHKNCIKEWIKRTKETCPFCRKIIDSIDYVTKVGIMT